jgi:AraC-like DNA-binding protein
VIIMLVPRAVLTPALAVMNLHGHALHNAAGRLLSDYLHLLVGRLPGLTEIEAPFVAKATADILVSCVLATGAQIGQAPPVDIVRRAARLIDRAPAEVFTPEKLQAMLNLSRSSLYRAFEPLGGVAGFIRQRRLARIHAMLCAGDDSSVTQLAASFGFAGAAQLTRAFRGHFGYSISTLKLRTRLPDAAAEVPVTELFESWTKALS